jgi:hypothetical protein
LEPTDRSTPAGAEIGRKIRRPGRAWRALTGEEGGVQLPGVEDVSRLTVERERREVGPARRRVRAQAVARSHMS